MKIREWEIPAGVIVAPAMSLIHRRADLYPEPDAFQPERFLGKKPDPYAYFPFGGGMRRCIGMAFALFEMKIVMVAMLRRAKLTLQRPGPCAVKLRGFVLAPDGGTPVVFTKRLVAPTTVATAA